jgi:hypothetical protein
MNPVVRAKPLFSVTTALWDHVFDTYISAEWREAK